MENSLTTETITATAKVPRSKESYLCNQSALEAMWLSKTKSLPALVVMNRLLPKLEANIQKALEKTGSDVSLFSLDFYYVKNFIGLRYVLQDSNAVHFPDQTTNVITFRPSRNHLRVTYSPTKATKEFLPLKCVLDYKINDISTWLNLEYGNAFEHFNMQEAINRSYTFPILDCFETQEYNSLWCLVIENVVRQVVSNIGSK